MRFISEKPRLTKYTTGFKITNMTTLNFTPSTTFTPTTMIYSPTPAVTNADPLAGLGGPVAHAHNANKSVDLEKAKFRLVFILWPTLIGITMAL